MTTRIGAAYLSSRSAILDVIRAAGTVSRVELAQATGLTSATVSIVVRQLMADGLVREVGRAESTGGKPRVLLQLDPHGRYAVGVDLDIASITYVISDLGGGIVARWRRPGAGTADPGDVVHRIAADVKDLVRSSGIEPARLLGLGVVSPGPIEATTGIVRTPPSMSAWMRFPLNQALQDAVGLPVLLDNDATAAAAGEYWSGGAPGTTFAALYLRTGVGAGIVLDGRVYRGPSGNAGEIGHVCVEPDGRDCWCGNTGCIEAYSGAAAVVEAARQRGIELPGLGLTEDFAALARAATRGDGAAGEILRESARYLAVAAQTLAQVFDLDHIVLSGPGFAVAGSLYKPAIEERLAKSFARGNRRTRVTISSQAYEAAAIGGAAHVLQSELIPPVPASRPPLYGQTVTPVIPR